MRLACWLLLGGLLVATQAVHAQARYTCRTANGSTYVSDRPCRGAGTGTSSVYFGPPPSTPQYESPVQRSPDAAPHVQYLGPRCASLNDAIRTAHVRGLTYETISTMQRDYRNQCADEENEAYATLYREKGEKVRQRQSEKLAEKQQADETKLREQQCGESKRILLTKRARTDLTEGEKAELQRFEANYRARCG